MSTLASLVEPSSPKRKPAEPTPPAQIAYDGDKYVDVIPYNAYFDDKCRHWLFWLYDKLGRMISSGSTIRTWTLPTAATRCSSG